LARLINNKINLKECINYLPIIRRTQIDFGDHPFFNIFTHNISPDMNKLNLVDKYEIQNTAPSSHHDDGELFMEMSNPTATPAWKLRMIGQGKLPEKSDFLKTDPVKPDDSAPVIEKPEINKAESTNNKTAPDYDEAPEDLPLTTAPQEGRKGIEDETAGLSSAEETHQQVSSGQTADVEQSSTISPRPPPRYLSSKSGAVSKGEVSPCRPAEFLPMLPGARAPKKPTPYRERGYQRPEEWLSPAQKELNDKPKIKVKRELHESEIDAEDDDSSEDEYDFSNQMNAPSLNSSLASLQEEIHEEDHDHAEKQDQVAADNAAAETENAKSSPAQSEKKAQVPTKHRSKPKPKKIKKKTKNVGEDGLTPMERAKQRIEEVLVARNAEDGLTHEERSQLRVAEAFDESDRILAEKMGKEYVPRSRITTLEVPPPEQREEIPKWDPTDSSRADFYMKYGKVEKSSEQKPTEGLSEDREIAKAFCSSDHERDIVKSAEVNAPTNTATEGEPAVHGLGLLLSAVDAASPEMDQPDAASETGTALSKGSKRSTASPQVKDQQCESEPDNTALILENLALSKQHSEDMQGSLEDMQGSFSSASDAAINDNSRATIASITSHDTLESHEQERLWKSLSEVEHAGERPVEFLPLQPGKRQVKERHVSKHSDRAYGRPEDWLSPAHKSRRSWTVKEVIDVDVDVDEDIERISGEGEKDGAGSGA
jgi:hypothetical protein